MRNDGRKLTELRAIRIERNFIKHADGAVLIAVGETKLICTASFIDGVPKFLKGSQKGWLTAEYGMLPKATQIRTQREAKQGHQQGRTQEIQRLIGRSLRHAIDLHALGENTIIIDCDVIQADGGTRCAAITGGCIALYDLLTKLKHNNIIKTFPFKHFIAAISVGVVHNKILLDLNYQEDSKADVDMNVVMKENGNFIEIQGTAENQDFSQEQLDQILKIAKENINFIIEKQKQSTT